MWTDFLAYIWPALPMFFFAGCCFVIAGVIWLVAIRRHEVTMGPPPRKLTDPPTVVLPRADSVTEVIPRIPGATPDQLVAVARMLDAVDRAADETAALTPIVGLREERIDLGPVCPICGGPFHPVCPSAPGVFPPFDECPLTTGEIEIPTLGETPVHAGIASREPTRDLGAVMEKVRQA